MSHLPKRNQADALRTILQATAVVGLSFTILLVATTRTTLACNVPVFRYAMTRWVPIPYHLFILTDGSTTDEQRAMIDSLLERDLMKQARDQSHMYYEPTNPETDDPADVAEAVDASDEATETADTQDQAAADNEATESPDQPAEESHSPEMLPINIRVTEVNMDEAEEDSGPYEFWSSHEKPKLPYMVLIRPHPYGGGVPTWHGPLTEKSEELIIDSPARQQIAKRLAAGDVAVWVLLESGNSKQDFEAEKTLRERLPENSNRLINYEIVRVSRKDPAEQVFVDLLMSCEEGLEEYIGKTMVFPVFGRGRALYALVGAGINNDNIDEACMHMAGACMCTDKDRALGADMLMRFDWDKAAYELPELTVDDLAEAAREAYEAAQAEAAAENQAEETEKTTEPSEGETSAAEAPSDTETVAPTGQSLDSPADPSSEAIADTQAADADSPTEDPTETEAATTDVATESVHTPSEEVANIDEEEAIPLVGLGTIAKMTSGETKVARSTTVEQPADSAASIWEHSDGDTEQPQVEMLAMADTQSLDVTAPGASIKPPDEKIQGISTEPKIIKGEKKPVAPEPAPPMDISLKLILFGTLGLVVVLAVVASVLMWMTARDRD